MRHLLLKTCVAAASALGFAALSGPASAVTPLTLNQGPSLLIQVEDMEAEAVEEDLRPDEMPDSMESEEPMMESGSDDGGNMEDEAIEESGAGDE